MRRLLALLLLVLVLPVGAQPIATDLAVTLELHERGGEYTFQTPCSGSRFQRLGDGFLFREDAPGSTGRGLGCGEATRSLEIPAGARLLLVSFDATGSADAAAGAEGQFDQAVELRDVNGALLLRVPFEAPEEGSRVVLPRMEVPDRVDQLELVWTFADLGLQPTRTLPAVDPGVAHETRVESVDIAFGGIPADGTAATWSEVRSARALTPQVQVHVPVPSDMLARHDVAVWLQSPPSLRLHKVEGPDSSLELPPAGEEVRHRSGQLVVPLAATAEQGPGTYTITLRQTEGVPLSPWLGGVALLFVVAPLPLAALAFRDIRTFGQQAFGRFRRSAVRLRVAVVLALLYYLVVVVAAIVSQRLFHLAALPPTGEAWFLYGQIALALAAFVVLWLVARDLAAITRPDPGKRGG